MPSASTASQMLSDDFPIAIDGPVKDGNDGFALIAGDVIVIGMLLFLCCVSSSGKVLLKDR